jgi:hypothetical protein
MSELMPMQNPVTKIEPKIAARLAKQSYHLVGEHGGVKGLSLDKAKSNRR